MLDSRNDIRGGRRFPLPRRHDNSTAPRAPRETGLEIASAATWVAPVRCLDEPLVAWLVSEDVSWQIAREQWRARRPHLWHRQQRASWRADRRVLNEKRTRLREAAAEIGLLPTAVSKFAP